MKTITVLTISLFVTVAFFCQSSRQQVNVGVDLGDIFQFGLRRGSYGGTKVGVDVLGGLVQVGVNGQRRYRPTYVYDPYDDDDAYYDESRLVRRRKRPGNTFVGVRVG